MLSPLCFLSFFFFNDTATTEIYTLSLHDALPIYPELERHRHGAWGRHLVVVPRDPDRRLRRVRHLGDRKSTRLNSSHGYISYAVFCLKKKKKSSKIANLAKATGWPKVDNLSRIST